MEILAPIDSVSQIKLYSFLGVGEFYCGYVPLDWFEKYNVRVKNWTKNDLQLSLNRREIRYANIASEEEILSIIDLSHKSGIKVYVTLNAAYYAENNYPFVLDFAHALEQFGVDGLIVSDPGLIYAIRKTSDIKIILSTCNQIASIEGVKFMQSLGVNRIVFPRHISLKELEKITNAVPDMEYECFILEGRCVYDDGNCNILHSCGSFCTENWFTQYFDSQHQRVDQEKEQLLRQNEFAYQLYTSPYINTNPQPKGWRNYGCGVCALPFILKNTKIDSIKVAGRGIDEVQKFKNISILKKVLKMCEEGLGPEEICAYMKANLQPWQELCDDGYRCYFPDSRELKIGR